MPAMTTFPKVAVVILNWNGQALLEKFLPSVCASVYPNLEIIVGDNASADGSAGFVRANFPEVSVLTNDENYGYAGGYNCILERVNADYLVLLNSDVEVTPNWIQPVIDMMETNPAIAVAQPKLLAFKHQTEFEYAGAAGGFIDRYGYPFCRGRIFDSVETDHGQYNDEQEIFWASGAALFIRKTCWDEAGGLDANFFAHMEEIDLCWRLKNMGHQIWYCPGSIVYHLGAGTLGTENPQKTYLNFRNNLLMLKKNLPAGKAFRVIFIRFWLDLISLLRFAIAGNGASAKAISKAHRHFFRDLKKAAKPVADLSRANRSGTYKRSIVWDYFVARKTRFSDLSKKDFR